MNKLTKMLVFNDLLFFPYLQSRAQVATEFLLELNEDVCGDYIEDVSM
jgi:hypothetical protein